MGNGQFVKCGESGGADNTVGLETTAEIKASHTQKTGWALRLQLVRLCGWLMSACKHQGYYQQQPEEGSGEADSKGMKISPKVQMK